MHESIIYNDRLLIASAKLNNCLVNWIGYLVDRDGWFVDEYVDWLMGMVDKKGWLEIPEIAIKMFCSKHTYWK